MKQGLYLTTALALLVCGPAFATENGTQHYPIGVNSVAAGNLPLPGMLQYFDYAQMATTPVDMDNNGNKINNKFDLTAVANASRFLYTWTPQIGPFHYTSGIVVPIVSLNLHVAGMHGSDFHPGDIDLQNYLGGATADHKFFYFFGLDTYVPTGDYSRNALINTGL